MDHGRDPRHKGGIMKRFPKISYTWEITTPAGRVNLTIAPTQWDVAGPVTLRHMFGYDHLRQYFLAHGQGMYGHAIDLGDKYMIPEDIHHILLMNETIHHRTDLIQDVKLVTGFVPDESWLRYNDENAGMMEDDAID